MPSEIFVYSLLSVCCEGIRHFSIIWWAMQKVFPSTRFGMLDQNSAELDSNIIILQTYQAKCHIAFLGSVLSMRAFIYSFSLMPTLKYLPL